MDFFKAPEESRDERLTRLVEAYQKPLLDMCYIYLRDRELAEDAVQETFLKAYKAMSAFRGESSEKTWLTRIAVNTCRDMRRSAWFRHVHRGITPEELPIPSGDGYDQSAIDVANAIMRLPDAYREVILLHYFQEMKLSEISSITGMTASMVSRRIKKAHEALHALLGKEYLYG